MSTDQTIDDSGNSRIRSLYESGHTQEEIAEVLEKSQSWVSKKMKQMDIDTRAPDPWSEKEERILEKRYTSSSKGELCELLPKRSWNAIKLKARKLGVAKSAREHQESEIVADRLRALSAERMIQIDFSKTELLSYILGVIDGDGFHDNENTVGLEVTSEAFADKFSKTLNCIGLNPGRGTRQDKETVWAASKQLVNWIKRLDYDDKQVWLTETGDRWKYIEGRYESDGNIHPSGSPRICSYNENAKIFLSSLLNGLGVKCSIQQNNVWISKNSVDRFFQNIDPVLRKRS